MDRVSLAGKIKVTFSENPYSDSFAIFFCSITSDSVASINDFSFQYLIFFIAIALYLTADSPLIMVLECYK